jgi:hypothetical protein
VSPRLLDVWGRSCDRPARPRRATTIPLAGLFNTHVHLVFDTSLDFLDRMRRATQEELRVGAVDRPRQLVRAGVTTVRDLGDRDQLAVSVRSAGVVVMASGGQITPGGAETWESQFTVDQLRTIVSHAATHGLPVAAHAHGADAIEACVEAGVATIEHCAWLVGPRQIDLRDDVAKRLPGSVFDNRVGALELQRRPDRRQRRPLTNLSALGKIRGVLARGRLAA